MKKFLYDLLRDRGSSKISTTKVFAFVFGIFLLLYSTFALFVEPFLFEEYREIDHVVLVEFLTFMTALLGLKNNWGVGSRSSRNSGSTYSKPKVATPPPSDTRQEKEIDDDYVF
jgi:hypothetical protein